MRERDIERYLVRRVKELGGEVRKVAWVGRKSAPDRFVMLPEGQRYPKRRDPLLLCRRSACGIWVEVKNPDTIRTFPADARERAQAREHQRMGRLGQRVEVVGTLEGVDRMLAS